MLAGCDDYAYPAEIPEQTAIVCLLGEARGEGYTSLLYHAEALRNRATINGVYGCKARLAKEWPYLQARGLVGQARQAWRESETTDFTHGATYWGSLLVDQKWIAKMEKSGFTQTAKIKNTVFYKAGKK